MNDDILKLVWRMVLNVMAGKKKRNDALYEKYLRARHLYVTIEELLKSKRERTA